MRRSSFLSRSAACALAAIAALTMPLAGHADTFPSRVMRIIVPFPAGGTQDTLARTVADALAPRLKQPVVVENRSGAAGNIGADVLAKAAPDGYTLGILSGVQAANAAFYRRLPYNLERDFVPVAELGDSDIVIVASPRAPFASLPEFVAYAKSHPQAVNFGSTTSLTMDLFKVRTGATVTMVTYKGPSDAMQDLISGRIDLSAGPLPQMLPLIRDGKIRALALASARRSAQLPGVATVAETVPGYDAGMWYGMFAPAGTPPDVLRMLSAQLASALTAPETITRLEALGVVPASGKASAAEVLARMRSETAQWRKVVEQTGNYAN